MTNRDRERERGRAMDDADEVRYIHQRIDALWKCLNSALSRIGELEQPRIKNRIDEIENRNSRTFSRINRRAYELTQRVERIEGRLDRSGAVVEADPNTGWPLPSPDALRRTVEEKAHNERLAALYRRMKEADLYKKVRSTPAGGVVEVDSVEDLSSEVRSWDPTTWPEAKAKEREVELRKAREQADLRLVLTGIAEGFAQEVRRAFLDVCEEVGLLERKEGEEEGEEEGTVEEEVG